MLFIKLKSSIISLTILLFIGALVMGTFSIWHWLIVAIIVLVLFGGGGKLSRIMGDFGKGLKEFKKNVKDDDDKNKKIKKD